MNWTDQYQNIHKELLEIDKSIVRASIAPDYETVSEIRKGLRKVSERVDKMSAHAREKMDIYMKDAMQNGTVSQNTIEDYEKEKQID